MRRWLGVLRSGRMRRSPHEYERLRGMRPRLRDGRKLRRRSLPAGGRDLLHEPRTVCDTLCVDGKCCGTPCNGVCERCDQQGSEGTCTAAPAGTDPDNECAADPVSSCGGTGSCSGAGSACAQYPPGTVCQAASCASSTSSNSPDTCNGSGTCLDAGTVACAAYTCDGPSGLCNTTCTTNGQCAAGYTCDIPSAQRGRFRREGEGHRRPRQELVRIPRHRGPREDGRKGPADFRGFGGDPRAPAGRARP